MKMKDYIGIDKTINEQLKNNVRQRDFTETKKNGLFSFGEELYNTGHSYEEFMADVIVCFLSPKDQVAEIYDGIFNKYLDTKNFPSLESIIKLVSNTNYLKAIENGYNFAIRKDSLQKKGVKK